MRSQACSSFLNSVTRSSCCNTDKVEVCEVVHSALSLSVGAGSMACFRRAHTYISGFLPVRTALVVGNHDLEGEDFETDEENLAAWREVSLFLASSSP